MLVACTPSLVTAPANFFFTAGGYCSATQSGMLSLPVAIKMAPGIGAYPLQPMKLGRSRAAAACLDQTFYVMGGLSNQSPSYLNNVEAYEPATGSWGQVAAMPTARGFLAAAVCDRRIYAIGGWDMPGSFWLPDIEAYEPLSKKWDASLKPLPSPRFGIAAATIGDRIYVVGGIGSFNQGSAGTTLEAYHPATNSWSSLRPMPTGRYGLAAAVLDGKLYAIGGYGVGHLQPLSYGAYVPLADVEVYDPGTDRWCIAPKLQQARVFHAAVTLAYRIGEGPQVREIIYAIGGEIWPPPIQAQPPSNNIPVSSIAAYPGLP